MDRKEILRRVITVVAEVLNLPEEDIAEDSAFIADLGAESIQSLELVAAFEEEFDIEMDEDAALKVQTISDAVDCITRYVQQEK